MRGAFLLLLLALVPTAAACSLVGEPPGAAMFQLHAMDGSSAYRIPVQGRMLGAGCELSNPHVLVEGTFAWLEAEWNPSRRTVHLHDLATSEERVIEFAANATDAFGLWKGTLLYQSTIYDEADGPATSVFLAQDIASGDMRRLPFPPGSYPGVAFGGPHIAASMRTNGHEGPDLFYLYDLETDRFLVEGRLASEFVAEDIMWPGPVGDGFVILQGVARPVVYNIATGETTPLPEGMDRFASIADGYAYSFWSWGDEPQRMRLPDGEREPVEPVKGTLVGIVPGYYVVGDYGMGREAPPDPAPGTGVPVASILRMLAAVLLGPLAWLVGRVFGLS